MAVVEEMHACMRAYTCRARGTSMPPLLLSGIRVLGRQNLSTPGRVVDDNHRASNPIGPGAFRRATSLKSSCAMVICSISVAVPARSKTRLAIRLQCDDIRLPPCWPVRRPSLPQSHATSAAHVGVSPPLSLSLSLRTCGSFFNSLIRTKSLLLWKVIVYFCFLVIRHCGHMCVQ